MYLAREACQYHESRRDTPQVAHSTKLAEATAICRSPGRVGIIARVRSVGAEPARRPPHLARAAIMTHLRFGASSPMAEARVLKTLQYGFESRLAHSSSERLAPVWLGPRLRVGSAAVRNGAPGRVGPRIRCLRRSRNAHAAPDRSAADLKNDAVRGTLGAWATFFHRLHRTNMRAAAEFEREFLYRFGRTADNPCRCDVLSRFWQR